MRTDPEGRMIVWIIIMVFVCALVLAVFSTKASAHEWYPISCCSDKDCRALDEAKGEWVKEEGKLWVLWDGRKHPKSSAGWSPDGKFHLCENPSGLILCFFAPVGGM